MTIQLCPDGLVISSWFDDDIDSIVQGKIPPEVRREVLERDHHSCQVSGRTDNLSIHHVKFRRDGGEDKAHNLITLNREVHDWLHFNQLPDHLWATKQHFILARLHILRDVGRIKQQPQRFPTAYAYVRAMLDGINRNDPTPINSQPLNLAQLIDIYGLPKDEWHQDSIGNRIYRAFA